jgi:aspartyl/asparaginyl-tRNA synthetase
VREHGSEFLFVTGYPMAKRPFYTHPDPALPGYSNGFDLLFRGLELVTGGQRLHRHADYLAALAAGGEDPAPYSGYLQVFEHGMPRTGVSRSGWNAGPPADRRGQHPPGHPVPPGPAPAQPVTASNAA